MSRSSNRAAGRLSDERGFTLIEVLVGFAIMALSLTALFQIFSTGMRNVAAAERYTEAVLLAESTLAGVGREQPLTAGETSGEWESGFRWRLTARPYEEMPAAEGLVVDAFVVTVVVSWGDPDDQQSVSLETLRLVPHG